MEAQLCAGEEGIVVGGGNSAGQAAVFLAQTARHVHVLIRSDGLAETMSRYLIRRIEGNPAITLHTHTEIVALEGTTHLERVQWRNNQTGAAETHGIRHVFMMAGATPSTQWLDGCIALDAKDSSRQARIFRKRTWPTRMAARPGALSPRNEPPRSLRGRRRPGRQRQARGLSRRRRLDRGVLRSPGASRVKGASAAVSSRPGARP